MFFYRLNLYFNPYLNTVKFKGKGLWSRELQRSLAVSRTPRTLSCGLPSYSTVLSNLVQSLSNHDDDGNKNPTNLRIWQWKTVFLHASHEHFSSFDILISTAWSELQLCGRREHMMTNANFCLFYVPSAGSYLIAGWLGHIFQAQWLWITEKLLQKRDVTFSDDVLASVDVVFA